MIRLLKVLVLATPLVALSMMIAAPASAQHHGGGHGGFHGHDGHGHVHFGVGIGLGWPWWGWPGYGYYYPPAYYYPPYYAYGYPSYPPPYNAYASSGTVAPAPQCRDYHGDATVDASGAPFHGRACLEADGRWHIIN